MSSQIPELLKKSHHIHFVGIGGSGMFPIVQILLSLGYEISGSDVLESSIIHKERAMGIPVMMGHRAENVEGADMLVVTAALLPGNPEVERAEELGIPVIQRADMLGYLTHLYSDSICISGTHGKTTTSALLTSILVLSGYDPSAVIGGKLPLIDGYGRAGSSGLFVVEACEFKDTFLHLSPSWSVILDIDDDHLDYFGTVANSMSSFRKFAKSASTGIIANIDDANTVTALNGLKYISFGEKAGSDYLIYNVNNEGHEYYSFSILKDDIPFGTFRLNLPGRHNVHNAAAAIAAASELGVSVDGITKGIESFKGASRRFEMLGTVNGLTIADDYAHHPTEIEATLSTAKRMGYNAVWAVFQPFTYSRTKQHLERFAEVLSTVDKAVITPILGSRETDTLGISSEDLAALIPGSYCARNLEDAAKYCLENAPKGSLVMTLGCGDVYKCAHLMLGDSY